MAYDELKSMIDESNNIVFLGGAGVSTESGIPDFRSADGLYNAKIKYGVSPEEMISRTYFDKHTAMFYDYYLKNMVAPDAKPNVAHFALAELEKRGKLKAVVTQNIDNLHQLAGSQNVLELHGSVYRNYCMDCHEFYTLQQVMEIAEDSDDGIPRCEHCGAVIKPDVVLYEEPLDNKVWDKAYKAISEADVLIVGGTSLVVYPAASLVSAYRGKKLVLINKGETTYDHLAAFAVHDSIGKVFSEIV